MHEFDPWPGAVGATAAVAHIQTLALAWELPYATNTALKKKKKAEEKLKKVKVKTVISTKWERVQGF